ncbi:MAG: universal stress protein, partial [Chloroflexi bacterium]|nr:universal stress protein [Chloroflexota bacterium]
VANSLREDGLEVNVECTVGEPAQEIIAMAKRKHTDVIAMATRGRSGIGRGFLGSVTDKVAHSSAIPMLVVRPGEGGIMEPISRLIVGLDGSRVSEAALDPACHLAASLEVPVLLLRATAVAARMALYGGEPYFAAADLYGDTDEEAKKYLDSIAARQKELVADVETRVGPGVAYNELQTAAAEQPGSLIILATRGRSGLTRWVLGSVTDRIIRSSDGPVLVIPPTIGGWT